MNIPSILVFSTHAGAPGADGTDGGALEHFTESRNTSAPNATVPAHSIIPSGGEASIDAAFGPKGSGALLAQVPDGTALGGIKRGANSVDWQQVRDDAAQVAAAAESVIGGGKLNEIGEGNDASVIAGGNSNKINATTDGTYGVSVISGGEYNEISPDVYGATISGGYSNTIYFGSYNVIAGGAANRVGYGGGARDEYVTVSGGGNNVARGFGAWIPGGVWGDTLGIAHARAWGAYRVAGFSAGESLRSQSVGEPISAITTDDTPIDMVSYGSRSGGAQPADRGTYNVMVLPDNTAVHFRARVLARNSNTGAAASWRAEGTAIRGVGAATISVIGSTVVAMGSTLGGGSIEIVGNTTYGALVVRVTGIAGVSLDWAGDLEVQMITRW